MALIYYGDQFNLEFGVAAINRASLVALGLKDSDVTGLSGLTAFQAQMDVVKLRVHPSDYDEVEAVKEWVTWLAQTGNLSDTTIAALTNVKTTGNANELRFNFFTLITNPLFTDATYADTLTMHPNI